MSTQHCWQRCRVCHGYTTKITVIRCCGHIMWFSTRSSQRRIFFYPLVPHMHHCHSSMPSTILTVKVKQTCFLKNSRSSLFKHTRVLILRPFTSTRNSWIRFHVSTSFGISALIGQPCCWYKRRHCWAYAYSIFLEKKAVIGNTMM